LVPGLFEGRGNGVKHVNGKGAGQFGARNLNASQVTVVANAQFAEAQLAQAVLGSFYLLEDFAGYGATVLDTR
jgi:hypothetical protein